MNGKLEHDGSRGLAWMPCGLAMQCSHSSTSWSAAHPLQRQPRLLQHPPPDCGHVARPPSPVESLVVSGKVGVPGLHLPSPAGCTHVGRHAYDSAERLGLYVARGLCHGTPSGGVGESCIVQCRGSKTAGTAFRTRCICNISTWTIWGSRCLPNFNNSPPWSGRAPTVRRSICAVAPAMGRWSTRLRQGMQLTERFHAVLYHILRCFHQRVLYHNFSGLCIHHEATWSLCRSWKTEDLPQQSRRCFPCCCHMFVCPVTRPLEFPYSVDNMRSESNCLCTEKGCKEGRIFDAVVPIVRTETAEGWTSNPNR